MKEFAVTPSEETRAGRMLAQGHLVVTVKSLKSGDHVTVKMVAKTKPAEQGGRWGSVPFAEASHVFVSEYSSGEDFYGRKVGTYYPRSGKWYDADGVSPSRVFSAMQAFALATGAETHAQAEVTEHDFCGRCGRELTDPDSIALGIGPECERKLGGNGERTSKVAKREGREKKAEEPNGSSEVVSLIAPPPLTEVDPSLSKLSDRVVAQLLGVANDGSPEGETFHARLRAEAARRGPREVGPQESDRPGEDIFGAAL